MGEVDNTLGFTLATSASSQRIAAIVSQGLARLLKAHAYRKQRHHFFRGGPTGTAHLSVQASQWNSPDRASFTINLWSYLPAIAQAQGKVPTEDPLRQSMGHCGIRIGHLFPTPGDYWWNAGTDGEVEAIAAEVASAVGTYGLPYLERIATLEGVAELGGYIPGIGNNPTEPKAIALRLLGREQEAVAVEEDLRAQYQAARQRVQHARTQRSEA